jgi:TolB-like protein
MPNILNELTRRNVFRAGAAYTVVAWVVAQAFDLAVDNFGAPPWVMRTLLTVLVAGLPVTLILAWAFEITPDGVKKSHEVPVSESITPSTGKLLNRITTTALVLLVAFVAWDKLWPGGESTGNALTEKSVAVLPFSDLSEGQDQEWFVDGLTEEILNSLARLPELQVTARTSSFEFKNTNIDISEIASRLGVANVVEGSVRRIGDKLRVTAQLIRASDGIHLWSDTYDRNTEDLFEVQRDVAENIAATLDVILDDEKRSDMFAVGTRNVAAFEAYLQGQALFAKAHSRVLENPVSLAEVNVYFERAMELDPTFSLPAIPHSDRYAHFLIEGPDTIVGDSADLDVDSAYALLNRDIEFAVINAPDPETRIIAELNREFFSPHWHRLPGLIEQLKEIVAQGGSLPRQVLWLYEILIMTGEVDLGEHFVEQELLRDPLNSFTWGDNIDILIRKGELDAASKLIEQTRRALGESGRLRVSEVNIALIRGDISGANALLQNTSDFSRDVKYFQPLRAAVQGDIETALRLTNEIENASEWPQRWLAQIYFEMGDAARLSSLVRRVDAMKVGPAVLGIELAFGGGFLWFSLDDAPNLKRQLGEAQIDVSSIKQMPFRDSLY